MKRIAFVNQKGGVGKTTSAVNISAGLAMLGKKVLVVDLDPQANLTYSFGMKAHELEVTVYDLLKGEAECDRVVVKRDGVDVIPSTLDLAGFDLEFSSKIGRENRLKRTMKAVENYDYVIMDCPPSLGLLTLNAIIYCSEVFIILQPEYLALKGMDKLLETLDEVIKEGLNDELKVSGILLTMYDSRKNLHKEVSEKIKKDFGDVVFEGVIRTNVALAEAQSFGKTIYEYKSSSNGAEDYRAVSNEIIRRK